MYIIYVYNICVCACVRMRVNVCINYECCVLYYQLTLLGIIENRYSAAERLLSDYRAALTLNQPISIDLTSTPITLADIEATVTHFTPQYDVIINYLAHCQQVRTMEKGCDIDFATSYLCAYLYRLLPEHIDYVHMVRVRDLDPPPSHTQENYTNSQSPVTPNKYISMSAIDIPSPTIASACISKLQKSLAFDERAKAVVMAYVEYIRPRITRSNDYLLLSSSALGLTSEEVHERISTLVYRVCGKVCVSLYYYTMLSYYIIILFSFYVIYFCFTRV